VNLQLTASDRGRNGAHAPQVSELDQDVLLHDLSDLVLPCKSGIPGLDDSPRRLGELQEARDGRQSFETLPIEQGGHGPAMGMTTHDDMLDLEFDDGKLDRGRLAGWSRGGRRNDVAGIADDKDLTGAKPGDQVGTTRESEQVMTR